MNRHIFKQESSFESTNFPIAQNISYLFASEVIKNVIIVISIKKKIPEAYFSEIFRITLPYTQNKNIGRFYVLIYARNQ